jgi:hypothetical protein
LHAHLLHIAAHLQYSDPIRTEKVVPNIEFVELQGDEEFGEGWWEERRAEEG